MQNCLIYYLISEIWNKKWKWTLNLSSNLIWNSDDETNFPYKILLTDTQVSKIRKTFANNSSANTKFSKTQLPKVVQLGGLLFGPPIPIKK